MNIFSISHAMLEIEDQAKENGLDQGHVIMFYMWLSEHKFPGHTFNDEFISKVLKGMKGLIKEFEKWERQEVRQASRSSKEPW